MLRIIIVLWLVVLLLVGVFVYFLLQKDGQDFNNKYNAKKQELTNVVLNNWFWKKWANNFIDGLDQINIKQESFIKVQQWIQQHIVWMNHLVKAMFVALLCEWHLLIEWAPWLAKTKTVNFFSKLLWLHFQRIQFTPDMLPGDVIGVEIYNQKIQEFKTVLWPIVSNIILADEINRTTPKVQSAMLEAMQEKQITIAGKTHKLPEPFLVLATQNPIEQEWTYSLPEAQLDRFMMKILINYPNLKEEKEILDLLENETAKVHKTITHKQLREFQEKIQKIIISDWIKEYITWLVSKTREVHKDIQFGASPRASINLMFASKAVAFLEDRDFVMMEDIQKIFIPIMRHRIILNYEAIAEWRTTDQILIDMI